MARRIGDTDARRKVLVRGGRRVEGDQRRSVRNGVQRLQALGKRNGGAFPAQAKIEREIGAEAPIVVGVEIVGPLVTVISCITYVALGEDIGNLVLQISLQRAPFVITTLTLNKVLRADR